MMSVTRKRTAELDTAGVADELSDCADMAAMPSKDRRAFEGMAKTAYELGDALEAISETVLPGGGD